MVQKPKRNRRTVMSNMHAANQEMVCFRPARHGRERQCGREIIEMAVLRYFAGRRRLRYRRCLQNLRTTKGPPRGVPGHPNHARLGNATVRGYNSGNSLASQSRRVKPRFEAPPNGCFPEADLNEAAAAADAAR